MVDIWLQLAAILLPGRDTRPDGPAVPCAFWRGDPRLLEDGPRRGKIVVILRRLRYKTELAIPARLCTAGSDGAWGLKASPTGTEFSRC